MRWAFFIYNSIYTTGRAQKPHSTEVKSFRRSPYICRLVTPLMVVVEQLSQGHIAPQNCNGHNGVHKFQSLSYSAISMQSDEDHGELTGGSEISGAGRVSNDRFVERRDSRDHSSSDRSPWEGLSTQGNVAKTNEILLSSVLAGVCSPTERSEISITQERQSVRQQHVKRLELAVNRLEAQLDEVESSHGSLEVIKALHI